MARQNKVKVHQFHSTSSVGDAVTNCLFFVQSMLKSLGFESEVFSERVDPALSDRVRRLEDLHLTKTDLLLIHHSMGHDAFSRLAGLQCRKFLVYHNITPPQFFEERDPYHAYAVKGYSQLSLFCDIVESAIAVSSFNARQLSQRGFDNISVIPLLKDFAAIRDAPHSKAPYYDQSAVFRLLFVGRIVPHKCQHELIEFVDKVRSIGRVPLGLARTGTAGSHFSGDIFLAFSTAAAPGLASAFPIGPVGDDEFGTLTFVPWGRMDDLYTAVVHAVEEAVFNALVVNDDMVGRDGHRSPALRHERLIALLSHRP